MLFIALRTNGCTRKERLEWLSGLSIHIVTHKGNQVASQHCSILLVCKRKISNTARDYNTNIFKLPAPKQEFGSEQWWFV